MSGRVRGVGPWGPMSGRGARGESMAAGPGQQAGEAACSAAPEVTQGAGGPQRSGPVRTPVPGPVSGRAVLAGAGERAHLAGSGTGGASRGGEPARWGRRGWDGAGGGRGGETGVPGSAAERCRDRAGWLHPAGGHGYRCQQRDDDRRPGRHPAIPDTNPHARHPDPAPGRRRFVVGQAGEGSAGDAPHRGRGAVSICDSASSARPATTHPPAPENTPPGTRPCAPEASALPTPSPSPNPPTHPAAP